MNKINKILALIPDLKNRGFPLLFLKQIYFQDNRIWLRERLSRISGETLKGYIKNLLVVADGAENQ